jgi:signal peptidase I
VKPAGLDPVVSSEEAAIEPLPGGSVTPVVADVVATPEGAVVAAEAVAAPPRAIPWRIAWELLHDVSVAVLFCFFLVTFVAQAFRVQGTSMQPLLEDGERIVVNKLLYRFHPIQRGDVVVFWWPRDPKVSFIKRVVGLPGDVVELRNGVLFVNDREYPEPYLLPPPEGKDESSAPPTEVKPGYYYVLGDHRGSSNDSRNWGEVPEKYIYGKAVFRFWPFHHASTIR